ncbi:MAG: molybdopterin oxidoreductase [Flavonifractor plautii]
MKARLFWCALHLALDREEELARLCPARRREAAEERCPPAARSGQRRRRGRTRPLTRRGLNA